MSWKKSLDYTEVYLSVFEFSERRGGARSSDEEEMPEYPTEKLNEW
jgi:hypothetical protein